MKEFSFKQRLTTYTKLAEFVKEEEGKVGSKSVLVLGSVIGATLLGSLVLDPFPTSDVGSTRHYDYTLDDGRHGDASG